MFKLKKENLMLRREVIKLRGLCREKDRICKEKDQCFLEMISDGLRHGSKLAAKHMADRKKYLNGGY